jgi:hypothetical protein
MSVSKVNQLAGTKTENGDETSSAGEPHPSHSQVWRHRNLVVVLGTALLARLIYFLFYLNSPCAGFLSADHIYYREWALRIRDGDWIGQGAFEQGPLYAYLLALQYMAGVPEPVIRGLQMLSGVAVCLLIYLCGRRLDERVATVAGVVTALYGPLLVHECELMKAFLSPLFVTLTLYFGLRYADAGQRRWPSLCGAAIGLACLLRESYVLLLLPAAAWVWHIGKTRQFSLPARAGALMALAASFGLVLLPSAVRNYLVAGEVVAVTTGGGEVMYIAHGPEADGYWHCRAIPFAKNNPTHEHQAYRDEAEYRTGRKLTAVESSHFWYGEAWREIKTNPGRFLTLSGKRALILLNDFEVPDSEDYQVSRQFLPVLWPLPTFGWIAGFGMLGLCLCLGDLRRHGLLIGLVAMIALSVLLTYTFGRFRLGMVPLVVLLATAGLCRWASWWRRPFLAGTSAALCLAITILSFLPPPGVSSVYPDGLADYWYERVIRQQKARARVAELARIAHANADVHAELGHQLIEARRLHEGFQHERMAIALAPSSARYWVAYSQDLFAAGHDLQAIDAVKEAISIDPRLGCDAGNALLLHVLSDRPDLLRKIAPELVALAEQLCQATGKPNPELLFTLASLYERADRLHEAIDIGDQAAALANKSANWRLALTINEFLARCREIQRPK